MLNLRCSRGEPCHNSNTTHPKLMQRYRQIGSTDASDMMRQEVLV